MSSQECHFHYFFSSLNKPFHSVRAMDSTNSSPNPLIFNRMVHMITIKLNSTNNILWKCQCLPILSSQGLMGYVNGSTTKLSPIVSNKDDMLVANPTRMKWNETDHLILCLVFSSLSKETMSEIVGLISSYDPWRA